jgi:hypothetical protein
MELRCHMVEETNWHEHLSMITFQYNATEHAETAITPFRALFGTDAFEFDCGLMWQWRVDDHPENFSERLRSVHGLLLSRGLSARDAAARKYDRAVRELSFQVGDRVLVYDTATSISQGRKLRQHFLGPTSSRTSFRLSRTF